MAIASVPWKGHVVKIDYGATKADDREIPDQILTGVNLMDHGLKVN